MLYLEDIIKQYVTLGVDIAINSNVAIGGEKTIVVGSEPSKVTIAQTDEVMQNPAKYIHESARTYIAINSYGYWGHRLDER